MNEILTPGQRIRRIAEIIDNGIYLFALKEGWFANPVKKENRTTQIKALGFEEQQIIDLCKIKGRITNKHVHDLLEVHRNTCTRKLRQMVSRKLLVQNGIGKGSFYILNQDFTKAGLTFDE